VPDDDFLVILLRACMHLNLYPDADWAVSVISVDQCCNKIAGLALDNLEEKFGAVPEEVKGKLIAWRELYGWVGAELGLRMVSHVGWENAIRSAAAAGDPEMQRVLLLLPAISDESHAEAQRMHRGEGLDVELAVDQARRRRRHPRRAPRHACGLSHISRGALSLTWRVRAARRRGASTSHAR
jgi:thioester reductase-like protein